MADEPKRRGRPPRVLAPTATPDRLAELTAREKTLAIRATARHRYTFDMPLDLYEDVLTQAEAWDQPLPDVVRACIRAGLNHIKQFGPSDRNPYAHGKLNPPAQHQIDPTGHAWPATGPSMQVTGPTYFHQPLPPLVNPLNDPPPMVFKSPVVKPGMLPNGFTDNLQEGNRHYDEHPPYNDPEIFGDDNGDS